MKDSRFRINQMLPVRQNKVELGKENQSPEYRGLETWMELLLPWLIKCPQGKKNCRRVKTSRRFLWRIKD